VSDPPSPPVLVMADGLASLKEPDIEIEDVDRSKAKRLAIGPTGWFACPFISYVWRPTLDFLSQPAPLVSNISTVYDMIIAVRSQ
jgi:hypothetical protein